MLKTFEVILDLERTLYAGSQTSFEISSGDLDSVEVTFLITAEGQPIDLTGLDALRLAIKKPSGLVVYQDLEITDPTGGEARTILTNQAYIEYGVYTAEVYLDDVDDVAVTCPFYYLSRSAILSDETIESQNDWSAIQNLLLSFDKKPILVEGVPAFVPEYVGQTAFDTIGMRAFISNGLTDVSWQVIGSGEGGGGGVVSWADILGKPATFPPTSHTHLWADIIDKPTLFDPSYHTHLWADITDKPTEFAPEAHLHEMSDITGLLAALDGKLDPADLDPYITEAAADLKYAFKGETGTGTTSVDWVDILNKPATFPPSAHVHAWTEITGKPTIFPTDWASVSGKPATFPPTAHTHLWADITDKPTTFAPTAHTHLWADITDKPTTFTPAAHTHAIADVTGLQAELDSKLETIPPEYLTDAEGDLRYAFKGDTGTGGGSVPVEDNLTSTSTTSALSANQGRILNTSKAPTVHTHLWADITDKPTTFPTDPIDWTDVLNKPDTFPPSAHTHLWAEITDKPTVFPSDPTDWADITNKPTTFTPSAHVHAMGDITGLIDALGDKAALVHTHLWADITDKPTTFAPAAHTHTIGDVDGLIDALDGKADLVHTHLWADITDKPTIFPTDWGSVSGKPTTFAPSAHTHLWADITDKPTTFTPAAHTHLWADITDKPTSFVSAWADITGKPTTFAPSAHTHLWADITDKPTTFTPSAHTHLWADITDKPTTFAPILMSGAQRGGAMVGNGLRMSGEYLLVNTASADGTKINTTTNTVAIDRTVVDTWYALKTHTHLWADITDKPTTFAPTAHTHPWTDVTGKPTTFAPSAHTHTETDLTFAGINAKTYVDNGDNAIINNYLTGHKIWTGDSATYAGLTKDPNTIYFVTG
jgi:baseplate upper protein BppU/tail fiber-like repeat protein/tail-like repeat protein